MAILGDSHVHSTFSGDGESTMEEQIEKAISLGMRSVTFTEHNDFDFPYKEGDRQDMFLLNADSYLYDLLSLKAKYEDKIRILFGVELGLQPQQETVKKNLIFARAHEYDFIIGSSHLCHGKDPYYREFFEGRSEEEAHREYFESILENMKLFSNFDVYGHLDYVVRYGPRKDFEYSYQQHADIIDEILKWLIENEKGIEVNTAGPRCGLKEPNPCWDIVKRYRELGGEIVTVGSDAHSSDYIAYHFDETAQILKELGFNYYAVYENRLPEYFKL
ncbi:MAG: histidinol-phosphatase HisJ family protein [Lachnospiraceae bacterium]|nr:histidinol-phosphatase HisJ family protein [Lachnospiraceae bacterium]